MERKHRALLLALPTVLTLLVFLRGTDGLHSGPHPA